MTDKLIDYASVDTSFLMDLFFIIIWVFYTSKICLKRYKKLAEKSKTKPCFKICST